MGSTAGVKGLDLGDIGCNGDGDVLRDPDDSADCGASVCGLGCVRKGGCKGNHTKQRPVNQIKTVCCVMKTCCERGRRGCRRFSFSLSRSCRSQQGARETGTAKNNWPRRRGPIAHPPCISDGALVAYLVMIAHQQGLCWSDGNLVAAWLGAKGAPVARYRGRVAKITHRVRTQALSACQQYCKARYKDLCTNRATHQGLGQADTSNSYRPQMVRTDRSEPPRQMDNMPHQPPFIKI